MHSHTGLSAEERKPTAPLIPERLVSLIRIHAFLEFLFTSLYRRISKVLIEVFTSLLYDKLPCLLWKGDPSTLQNLVQEGVGTLLELILALLQQLLSTLGHSVGLTHFHDERFNQLSADVC